MCKVYQTWLLILVVKCPNPFASLGVATQAAEIQMEQSDIALANSLDAMVATGAGAGGATALAQAALRSKKKVLQLLLKHKKLKMKNLEHKVNNSYNNKRIAEQQRLQGIAISEGQREQAAEAAGKQFEFNVQEDRTNADISYNIAKETGAAQRQAQARANRDSATAGIFTGIGNIAAGALSGGIGKG